MSMLTVFMGSDEFGYEEFHYDTLDEALDGIARLYEAALGDGVEREIGIQVNLSTEDESEDC